MGSPSKSKQKSNINRNLLKKVKVSEQRFPSLHKRTILDQELEQKIIKRILISKMIENNAKSERILDQSIKAINLVVRFSQKFSLTKNLPSTLTIVQLNQIVSSYSKLHLKNCSPQHSYAGIYVPSPFERKNMARLLDQSEKNIFQKTDEITSLTLQILEFIHQNTLLSRQYTQLDQKYCYYGIKTSQVEAIANLFLLRDKLSREQADYEKEFAKNDHNEQQILSKKKPQSLKILVRYDSTTSSTNNQLSESQNGVKSFKMPLAFLENISEAQSSPKQDIYIKEYTQRSETSSFQSNHSIISSEDISSKLEENPTNFITFDPKQVLDSGRLRADNKSLQGLMRWLNETQISDFLLLKDIILSDKTFPQKSMQSDYFLQFPLRLRGSSQTYELSVVHFNKMKTSLQKQMNQLINKIISSGLSLSCHINQFYFLQSNPISKLPKYEQNHLKKHKDTTKQKQNEQNAGNYRIFIADTQPFEQITLIQYLSNLLQTLTSKEVRTQNQHPIKKLISSIYYQTENLLKQLIQFGRLFMNEMDDQHVNMKSSKREIKNKPHESKDKHTKTIINLFETSQFWEIDIQQRHQFTKNPTYQHFSILSLFTCKKANKFRQNIQLGINFPQLVKKIYEFYRGRNQNKFIKKLPSQKKNDQNLFLTSLQTRLIKEFTSLCKGFSMDLNMDEIWNPNQFNALNENQQKINKFWKSIQINKNYSNQASFANILFHLTSQFLQRMDQQNETFFQTVISQKKSNELTSLFSRLKKCFNSYHSFKSQQVCQLRNYLCKSIQLRSLKLHECFTRPKSLYFSSGQALDLYEKETTLKKKKQSQSTSHKNSLDLHSYVHTTDFNHSKSKSLSQLVFSKVNSNFNYVSNPDRKAADEKENIRQNKSMKSDKMASKKFQKSKKDKKIIANKKI